MAIAADDAGSGHHSEWIGTVDLGLKLMVGKNGQFDTGVNLGVTRSAPDIQTVFGVSVRF